MGTYDEDADDPRDIDAERQDPERVREEAEARPLVHDQAPDGDQGITTDKPGVDPGGYPEEPDLPT
jgi:hypothetical protein